MATTSVEYGKTTEYGTTQTISTTASENTHTARLTGLDHSTTYHFRVRGVTSDGDDIFSQDHTFQTIVFPKVTAYVVKTNQNAGGTTVSLAWSTNVETTTVVEYQAAKILDSWDGNKSPEYLQTLSQGQLAQIPVVLQGSSSQKAKDEMSKTHIIQVDSLEDGAIYIFTLKGRDEYGNEAVSDPIRYVTGEDTRPPVLKDVTVETQTSGSGLAATAQILVSWETDEPATGQVVYGQGTGKEYPLSTPEDTELKKRHTIVIRDLDLTATYHLQIVSKDEAGNETKSEDLVVVTPASQESALDVVLKNLEDLFGFLKF